MMLKSSPPFEGYSLKDLYKLIDEDSLDTESALLAAFPIVARQFVTTGYPSEETSAIYRLFLHLLDQHGKEEGWEK